MSETDVRWTTWVVMALLFLNIAVGAGHLPPRIKYPVGIAGLVGAAVCMWAFYDATREPDASAQEVSES